MKQFDYLCAPYVPIDAQSEHSQPINEDCSNGAIPRNATSIGTLTEDGKREILVSEVTTIKKTFFDRNRSMMTRYINERLRDGSMRFIVPFAFTTRHITYLQRDYKSVKFWKMDRTHFIADVEVHLKLDTAEGVRVWAGIMTLWVDIEDNFASTIEDFVDKNNLDERDDMIALSNFLIPIYSSRQISDLEKAMGRKAFQEIVGSYVFKPEGTPELVPLSDRRKPISSAESDFAE